jgi:hypothetical protein
MAIERCQSNYFPTVIGQSFTVKGHMTSGQKILSYVILKQDLFDGILGVKKGIEHDPGSATGGKMEYMAQLTSRRLGNNDLLSWGFDCLCLFFYFRGLC